MVVTTDDQFLKRAVTQHDRLRVQVLTPDQVPLEMEEDQI
jgi:hypothetical protein